MDTLQETGVLCKLVCPSRKPAKTPIDKWNVSVDGIGFCEYRLKAELEALVSAKPEESGLSHYLKERIAADLGLEERECPAINRISLNKREKMEAASAPAPFLLLCETEQGAALIHLNTQYNCALLPVDEVFISCAWLPNGVKISCRNQPKPNSSE